MKTKEELNALKEEAETVSEKLHELTEEELAEVSGGVDPLDYLEPGVRPKRKHGYEPPEPDPDIVIGNYLATREIEKPI